MVIEVKKNLITFVRKNLNTFGNSKYKDMKGSTDRSGKNLIIGVTFSWTDYDSVAQSRHELIITTKTLKDEDIDAWITNVYCKEREIQKQESRISVLKSEIVSTNEYMVS